MRRPLAPAQVLQIEIRGDRVEPDGRRAAVSVGGPIPLEVLRLQVP